MVPPELAGRHGCHIANTTTGECTCLDYVWRGSGFHKCKHVQAARLRHDAADREDEKARVVSFLRHRERLQPRGQKQQAHLSIDDDEVFDTYCQQHDLQQRAPQPSRVRLERGRPAPLHQKRPLRRINTSDSHQQRVPSRSRQVKGGKPRRPSRLTPANRRNIDPPETDEIACVCGIEEEDDQVFVNCDLCGRWSHIECFNLSSDVTQFVCFE
ncbi:Hypp9549, partial [Branchiostoma lanceolatum]